MYAQAEDDFNRVETNYINAMGRLAEAEGEGGIYQDLRMKLFIDPDDLKARVRASPAWLKTLMNAWADGLNYYLYTHPQVKPRVITHFEPWMALSLHRGQHRRRHRERGEPAAACRRSTAADARRRAARHRGRDAPMRAARLERHRRSRRRTPSTITRCS